MDPYDEPPIICPTTGTYCARAFCDDYGCANLAAVPVDSNDVAAGSDPDDIVTLRVAKRRRGSDQKQPRLI